MPARRAAWLVVLALAACEAPAPAPPAPAPTLAAHLRALAALPPAARAAAVAGWRLSPAAWGRVIVEPYRGAHADYARAFDARAAALVTALAGARAIATRAHHAGDARLTRGQARARWALPVQFPSEVAEVDGAPLDAVFVRDGAAWRAIVGIDDLVLARAAALAPGCEAHLARVAPGPCGDLGWLVADAALRADRPRLGRACALAASQCR